MRKMNTVVLFFLAAVVFNCLRQLIDWSANGTQNILEWMALISFVLSVTVLCVTEWRDRNGSDCKQEGGQ